MHERLSHPHNTTNGTVLLAHKQHQQATIENKIEFPFFGDLINQKIILDSNFDKIKYVINKNREKDTLNFWFKNNQKIDSIIFNLKGSDSIEKVVVKKRKTQIKDSLILKFLNMFL